MPELLLLSNSTSPGTGFLEHARAEISGLAPPGSRLLFVPYASADQDRYTEIMTAALAPASIRLPPGSDVTALLATRPRFDIGAA